MRTPFQALADQVAEARPEEARAVLRFVTGSQARVSHQSILRNLVQAAFRAGVPEAEAEAIVIATIRESVENLDGAK